MTAMLHRLITEQYLVSIATILSSLQYARATVRLLSTPQHIQALPGESAECKCEFRSSDYSMFENPILWTKFQNHEETSINIMGNILEPFLSTNRFEVTFQADPPNYQLALRIIKLSALDSGNYTCEIRGRRSAVLAIVKHSISVSAPLEDLRIEVANTSSSLLPSNGDVYHYGAPPPITEAPPRALFIEGSPRKLTCVAEGGFPMPEMSITLDSDRDLTGNCQLSYSVELSGERGLRSISYRTERTCDRLTFSALDDNKHVRCIVTVPGLKSNHTSITVNVIYRPLIKCPKFYAYMGERNVGLRCEVRARPPLTALFWIIDHNGTTLTEGQIVNEFWTLVMDRSDGVMETQLFLKEVVPQSFRTYTLVAENSISANTAEVELIRKIRKENPDLAQADRPRTHQARSNYNSAYGEYSFMNSGTLPFRAQTSIFSAHCIIICSLISLLRIYGTLTVSDLHLFSNCDGIL